MIPTDNKELFEQYYQNEYDFNTTTLTDSDIAGIKKLVREKRVNYALAPIGTKVFEWILSENPNLRLELVDFDSEKIDGMLYIPTKGNERAYIILNSNKPLINQIFTAMHEYYHYERDYAQIKNNPHICNFASLENVNEKRASRFAAEFLLPEEALKIEVRMYRVRLKENKDTELSFADYAILSILLTLRYQLPLKAVIYRLYEENYILNIEKYIDNYAFIKNVLQEVNIYKKSFRELYSNINPFFETDSMIYNKMKNAYLSGLASREEIIRDAIILDLDVNVIKDFFEDISLSDEDEDDSDLVSIIQKKWRN